MGFNKEFRPAADFFPTAEENPDAGGVLTGPAVPVCVDLTIASGDSQTTMTNQSSALSDPFPRSLWFDAGSFKAIRVVIDDVDTAGAAGSRLIVKYALTAADAIGGTFSHPGIGGSEVAASMATTGPSRTAAFIELDPAAADDVLWHVFAIGGDGLLDPVVSGVHIQFLSGLVSTDCALFGVQSNGDDWSTYTDTAALWAYIDGPPTPGKYSVWYGQNSGTPNDWAIDNTVQFFGHATLKGIMGPGSGFGKHGGGWDSSFDDDETFTSTFYPGEVWQHQRVKFESGFATPDAGQPGDVGSLTLFHLPLKNLIDGENVDWYLKLRAGGSSNNGIYLDWESSFWGYTETLLTADTSVLIGTAGFRDIFWHLWSEPGEVKTIWHAQAYIGDACGPISPLGPQVNTENEDGPIEVGPSKVFYARFNNWEFFPTELGADEAFWNAGWQIAGDLGSDPWGIT